MFKEEINIYQTRCEKFLSRISSDRFSVEIPLEVEVGWSKNPVAFKDREKLSYRPIKEGESGAKHGKMPISNYPELCLMIGSWKNVYLI